MYRVSAPNHESVACAVTPQASATCAAPLRSPRRGRAPTARAGGPASSRQKPTRTDFPQETPALNRDSGRATGRSCSRPQALLSLGPTSTRQQPHPAPQREELITPGEVPRAAAPDCSFLGPPQPPPEETCVTAYKTARHLGPLVEGESYGTRRASRTQPTRGAMQSRAGPGRGTRGGRRGDDAHPCGPRRRPALRRTPTGARPHGARA